MNNKVSILLPTYKREHLLKWGLWSLAGQNITYDYEIIVLNDGIHDGTEELVNSYQDRLNVKHVFTGHRNLIKEEWRCPSFCLNIGVKQSEGDILIFSCPEMYHLNNTIDIIAKGVVENPRSMVIPLGKDDLNPGTFLNYVNDHNGDFDQNLFDTAPKVATIYPFLMGFMKSEIMAIGGYDEKMVGTCYDDTDLTYRLKRNGITYAEKLDAKAIHLYHPRGAAKGSGFWGRHGFNKQIFNQHNRDNVIVVNQGVDWGINK